MRLTRQQLDDVKQQYNVDRVWSFSRLSTWRNCKREYWARYMKHMHLDSDSVYLVFGNASHNLIQSVVDGHVQPAGALNAWEKIVSQWDMDESSPRFDNRKIRDGYINNLQSYFSHINIPAGRNFTNEKPVLTKVGKYIFVGYIDTQFVDEDNNLVLIDYKTSSKSSFTKAKLPEKSQQLMLYAIGKHQQTGLPFERIKARFDMLKYCRIHYKQENGKWKDTIQERSSWVASMEKRLRTKLKKVGVDEEKVNELVTLAALHNHLKDLPQEVQEQFWVENYYIELDITEETCQEVLKEIERQCDEIVQFESKDETDQEAWLKINARFDSNNYYDTHLCSYHTSDEFKKKRGELKDKLAPQFDLSDSNYTGMFSNDSETDNLFS